MVVIKTFLLSKDQKEKKEVLKLLWMVQTQEQQQEQEKGEEVAEKGEEVAEEGEAATAEEEPAEQGEVQIADEATVSAALEALQAALDSNNGRTLKDAYNHFISLGVENGDENQVIWKRRIWLSKKYTTTTPPVPSC